MIKLSKLTDYGFVLLVQFADSKPETWLTARDLSDLTGLPLPTVSKLLKVFSRGGLLSAHRGAYGGYCLTRHPEKITASEIIEVIDGPLEITNCVSGNSAETCVIEDRCLTRQHWVQITSKIKSALDEVTLAQLSRPVKNQPDSPSGNSSSSCLNGNCKSLPNEQCACGTHLQQIMGDRTK